MGSSSLWINKEPSQLNTIGNNILWNTRKINTWKIPPSPLDYEQEFYHNLQFSANILKQNIILRNIKEL